MAHYRLALIGFGGVNRALAELIQSADLDELGFTLSIAAITDLNLGTWVHYEGIDPQVALSLQRDETFEGLPGGSDVMDNRRAIEESNADIIVEATFTNPESGEPAASHIRWALEAGRHVTTTNKGPIAIHGTELKELARKHGVYLEFEGAVMSGTPVIRFAQDLLVGNRILGFEGVLNGTSNYVLGRMEAGHTQASAIAEAQDLGYAEANPAADIEGSDVQLKVAILANELLGAEISAANVDTLGINEVTNVDIYDASANGEVVKLIGRAKHTEDGQVEASVRPIALPTDHPLAGVSGPTNAVTFNTSLLGNVTIAGPGAGRVETAFALLSDITAIHKRIDNGA